jgi:hypothetical protein
MKPFAFAFLCFVLFGCDNAANQPSARPAYFDVAGFVNAQIQTLTAQKPPVDKNAIIKGQSNHQISRDIDWAKELALFLEADINKPAFRNSYAINRPDSLTYEYTLKPTEERLTVRELTVRLDPKSGKPARLTALLKTENPLYTSERHLLLESAPSSPSTFGVYHYQVEGFQQLTYFHRNDFRVEGRIGPR